MKKKLKLILIPLVALAIIFLAIRIVKKKKAALAKLPPPKVAPLPVEVSKVRKGKLLITEHYLGEIRPLLSAKITSRLSGYLLAVTKYEGDQVSKGEVLAKIDDRPIRDRIASLKSQIEAAKVALLTRKHIFERDKVLYQAKAISQEAFELSKAAFQEAEAHLKTLSAELATAKNDLRYAVLKAPFDGVVTARFKDPGDLVLPGTPILSVEAPSRGYRVFVRVPQAKAVLFRPGAPAILTEGEKRLETKIFRVHPAVGPKELAVVEIRLSRRPFGLPSGARVGVDLGLKEVEGAIVPLRALLENVETTYVFVAKRTKGDLARLKVLKVSLLGRAGEEAAVSGPLKDGDLVIVAEESTLLRLHEGEVVRIGGSL